MNFIVRPCIIEDAEAICQLNNTEMGYSYSLKDTVASLEKALSDTKQRVFVAEWDGKVIGYVHAVDYEVLYASPMKNILGIAVSKQYRQRGVGRSLLAEVEKWARESGSGCVRLTSGAERENAHAFYKKCGYEFIKQQFNFRKRL